MIIIRDLNDVDTLRRKIRQGDILEIYRIHYDVTKIYWTWNGILVLSYNEGDYADYCYEAEFFRDIRVALSAPDQYFIKLISDYETEVVRLDEDAII